MRPVMRPVGILGGMGPQATILLMQKVLEAVPDARDDADHVPLIVHQNPGVPSRIAALIEGTGPDPAPVLCAMARDLARAGATALAMPCNTAHHYADAIAAATDLPFLDMRSASVRALGSPLRGTRIGLLASPAVRLTGVFDAPFASAGLAALYPEDEAPILDMIRAIKAGTPAQGLAPNLAAQADGLIAAGAAQVLIACTELSLIPRPDLPVTDSLDCLVDAIVAHARA